MPLDSLINVQNVSKMLRLATAPRASFGDVIYAPGVVVGPLTRTGIVLVAFVEGHVNKQLDGRAFEIKAGQVALAQPGDREVWRFPSEKNRHEYCLIAPAVAGPQMTKLCHGLPKLLSTSRRLEQILEVGLSLANERGDAAQREIESLAIAALCEYQHIARRSLQATGATPDVLHRALDWIAQNESAQLDLEGIAQAAGVSAGHLVKLFKRHLGITPLRYVWEARTRHGGQLLRETGLTVAEVAYRCGFQSTFHFSRWIKTTFGISPRNLRKKAWGN